MLEKIVEFFKSIFGTELKQEIDINEKIIKNNVKKNTNSEINITNNLGEKND